MSGVVNARSGTRLLARSRRSRASDGERGQRDATSSFVELDHEALAVRARALAGLGEVPAAVVQMGTCLLAVPGGSPSISRFRDFLRASTVHTPEAELPPPPVISDEADEPHGREQLLRQLLLARELRAQEDTMNEHTHDSIEHGNRSYARARTHVRLEEYHREN